MQCEIILMSGVKATSVAINYIEIFENKLVFSFASTLMYLKVRSCGVSDS